MRLIPLVLAATVLTAAACSMSTDVGSTSATYKINFDSGTVDSTTSTVGAVVPVHFHLTVDGTRISAAPVAWTITAGSGRVALASTVTDSLGNGSALWVLGDTAGLNKLTLSVGSTADSIQLKALANPGPASRLVRVSADSVSAAAGSSVAINLRVVDALGNAVSGATVQWSTTGGSVSPAATTSDATGNAAATLVTGATPGSYVVTATLPGRATVAFQVVTK